MKSFLSFFRSGLLATFTLCLLATAARAQGLYWNLNGNIGTNPAIHFFGTTDNQPLCFRVNNQLAGKVDPLGENTLFGYQAGGQIGFYNTAIGHQALYSAYGDHNTANGYRALYFNTGGQYNTANGSGALFYNTSGHFNTATGYRALYYNTNASFNTANGYAALFNNTGSYNTATGYMALRLNTTGQYNTANGYRALYYNTTGYFNTANGNRALYYNTTGYTNTANGAHALYNNTTGSYNTANGSEVLGNNTTGWYNTANGNSALVFNTTGSSNTANGFNALYYNTTGNYNTALGTSADVSSGNLTNTTAIGYGAIVNASNKIRLGNGSVTAVETQFVTFTTSDRRFKKDIKEDVPGLEFIKRLRPVTYNPDIHAYNDFIGIEENIRRRAETDKDNPEAQKDVERELADLDASATAAEKARATGFIAQEVEQAANSCGYEFSGVYKPQNEKDNYALGYAAFTVPLVKAVQEQQIIIKEQGEKIEKQDKKIEDLEKKVEVLLRLLPTSGSAPASPVDLNVVPENKGQESDFAVFPNPAKDEITVVFNLKTDVEVSFSIMDVSGRLVRQNALGRLATGEHSANIDLSQVPNGSYFIQMTLNGKPMTKKIVVQR